MYLVDYLNKGYTVVVASDLHKEQIGQTFPGAKVVKEDERSLTSSKMVIDSFVQDSIIVRIAKDKYPNGEIHFQNINKVFVNTNKEQYIGRVTITDIFESEKLNINLNELDINEAINLLEKLRDYREKKLNLENEIVKLNK